MLRSVKVILKRYRLWGLVRLARDIIISRINYKNVRIIRHPWYFRGAKNIKFGLGFTSGVGLRLDAFGAQASPQIEFGINVELGDYVHIGAIQSVKIGDNCLLASRIYISDHDHGKFSGENQSLPNELQSNKSLNVEPVVIENNVWIGEGVFILKGVRIGANSIVGAGSVVTKSVPESSIVVGVPAKVIKQWDLVDSKWKSFND